MSIAARILLDPFILLLRYGKLRPPHLTACVVWCDARLSFLRVPALYILQWEDTENIFN